MESLAVLTGDVDWDGGGRQDSGQCAGIAVDANTIGECELQGDGSLQERD